VDVLDEAPEGRQQHLDVLVGPESDDGRATVVGVQWRGGERAQRALDPVIAAILRGLPLTTHPMDTLRTAVSHLGATDPAGNDHSPEANQARALRLFAVLPAVAALDQRRRRGLCTRHPAMILALRRTSST
jgi:hypothetical protein